MNYPLWSLPAKGLLIAAVAIVHVFISHFAVGGGLFLVLAERKARREKDDALLGYVRMHSRFFILLTLVMGAITGVGIWFTIGLVHPDATSSLINAFVWAWAIEWTFFIAEIAAALVYYYGWDRLDARTHQAVGWIYFVSAWMSLVVINGILSFMLTPGAWIATRGFLDGLLNPTCFPSLVARSFAAVGLAGLYALVTAATLRDGALKEKVARYAGRWILPMAVGLPVALGWYLLSASRAGVPVGESLGTPGAGVGGILSAVLGGSTSGHPILVRAVLVVLAASAATLLLSIAATRFRPRRFGLPLALATLACAFVALGAGEWAREDLRKPFVIGQYMYVNGVRTDAAAQPQRGEDRFSAPALIRDGVLQAVAWTRLTGDATGPARTALEGAEVFRLLCSSCHTVDGYVAIRPLVSGKSQATLRTLLSRLETWRGRRMPPLTASEPEREALSLYLAGLGGGQLSPPPGGAGAGSTGAQEYFDANCSACHGDGADFPIGGRGRTPAQLEEMLGRLPEINEAMPPFEGDAALRKALAAYLAGLLAPARKGVAR